MKLPGNKLKMADGSVHQFHSAEARAKFERVAMAVKHGFVPNKTKTKKYQIGKVK